MHYLRHGNYKLGKLLPIGILCSIGIATLYSNPASADALPTATIGIGNIVGNQQIVGIASGSSSFYVPISIKVENAAAYTVSLWADSSSLCPNGTCDGVAKEIEPVTTPTSLAQMPDDHWGYRYNFSTTPGEDESKNYAAMPAGELNAEAVPGATYHGVSVSGVPLGVTETKYLTLGYAAAVGGEMPAGRYKNSVTVSVLMDPMDVSMFGIDNMQDMTSDRCALTTTPFPDATLYDDTGNHVGDRRYIPRTMLKDTRDNHMYIVSKLADGNCWMTENLALKGGTAVTSENTNTEKSTTMQTTNNGDAGTDANYIFSFVRGTDPSSHYNTVTGHTGAFYSYEQAVLNSNSGMGPGGNALYDVCPKNWTLPIGDGPGDKRFEELLAAYNNNLTKIRNAFHIVFTGYYLSGSQGTNDIAYYWSRTYNGGSQAFHFSANSTNGGMGTGMGTGNGFSLRCVAK